MGRPRFPCNSASTSTFSARHYGLVGGPSLLEERGWISCGRHPGHVPCLLYVREEFYDPLTKTGRISIVLEEGDEMHRPAAVVTYLPGQGLFRPFNTTPVPLDLGVPHNVFVVPGRAPVK